MKFRFIVEVFFLFIFGLCYAEVNCVSQCQDSSLCLCLLIMVVRMISTDDCIRN